jgi:ubiquinone/menaquinone biosynthesis C-methylase UbiE
MDKNLESDLDKEKQKYNILATTEIVSPSRSNSKLNLMEISEWHREPFREYYEAIRKTVKPSMVVLELGAGCGNHTAVIYETNAKVFALDISEDSLAVCRSLFHDVRTIVGNIENIPLDDNLVDVVLSCGSLSYGDNETVKKEIFRVLKPGGSLIILDSLNHNFFYRVNRWIHYKKGKRTLSTLQRMPNQKLIQELTASFGEFEIRYFGSYLWLTISLSKLIGHNLARKLDFNLERCFPSKLGAFKVLINCKNLNSTKLFS